MADLASAFLLNNTASGWNKKHGGKVTAIAAEHNVTCHDVHNLKTIETALDHAANEGTKTLVVNGGDGTIDAVVTLIRVKKMFADEPHLVFLPGGTTNMTHHAAGYKAAPDVIFSDFIKNSADYTGKDLSPLSVDVDGGARKVYGFFLGGAAIPRAILATRRTYHKKGLTSTASQILSVGGTLLKLARGMIDDHPVLQPQDVQYSYDEYHWRDVETVFFYLTTLPHLLLNFPGAAQGGMAYAGLTHPYQRFWCNLIRFWRSKPLSVMEPGFFHQTVDDTIYLKLRGGWTLDGELYDDPREKDKRIAMTVTREKPVKILVRRT